MNSQEIHKSQSVECFNGVWKLLKQEKRTDAENLLMLEMTHASLYHWLQREDVRPVNESIGLWQISRVYAGLGDGENARDYGERCIAVSESAGLSAFYRGYGREAVSRAKYILGLIDDALKELRQAKTFLETVTDQEEREYLSRDLDELADMMKSWKGD